MRNSLPLLLLPQVACIDLIGGLIDDPLEADDTFGFIDVEGDRHPFSDGEANLHAGPIHTLTVNLSGSGALVDGLLGEGVGTAIVVIDDKPIGVGSYPLLSEEKVGTLPDSIRTAAGLFVVTTDLTGFDDGEDWAYCSSLADNCASIGKNDLSTWMEDVEGAVEITALDLTDQLVSMTFAGTLVGEGRTRSGAKTVQELGPVLADVNGEAVDVPVEISTTP